MIIFLVSGLWHGANWTFICWGAYHALLFLPYMILGRTKVDSSLDKLSLKKAAGILTTFCLVVIGWVIFRANNIAEAYDYIQSMFTNGMTGKNMVPITAYKYIVLLLVIEWLSRKQEQPFSLVQAIRLPVVRFAIYFFAVVFILIFAAPSQGFIYFQF
jgi:D-alanyl-lipoteichoic acid acyltransferase DltB (MBOAT superfamily)